MRRLIAVTLVAPAILAAAEQVKGQPGLLDRALTRGVTNDRPYLPTSRIEVAYQASRALIARTESGLMQGTLKTSQQAEIDRARSGLDSAVQEVGAITEHERHQYQEATRDLDALLAALAAIGLGTYSGPSAPLATPAAAAPVEAPPLVPTAPANEAPVETAPVDAPAAAKPVDPQAAPSEAPVVENPVATPLETPAVEKPAETPVAPVVEKPAEDPVAPAVEKPAEDPVAPAVEKPAETPVTPAVEKPAETPAVPAETPVLPAEKPAETPATPTETPALPAEKPAEAPAVPAEKPAEAPAVPAETPANALPPE